MSEYIANVTISEKEIAALLASLTTSPPDDGSMLDRLAAMLRKAQQLIAHQRSVDELCKELRQRKQDSL